jgi:NADH-quinone oxidoreductase subunit N
MMAFQSMPGLPQSVDYIRILPEIVLSIFGMLVMLLDPVMDERRSQRTLGRIALIGAIAALVATLFQAQQQYWGFAFWDMVKVDAFSIFFHFVVAAVVILVILSSYEYMDLMSSAMELVLIFIALEISSISTYILAGFRRKSAISAESSVKYFLLGSFATAFFLYGVALMFGATGSTNIVRIGEALRPYSAGHDGPILAYLGIALMFVGLGFKVAAAPFHIWTPDVYEGAPAPVVGFMSTAPKAAVFAVLIRIFFQAQAPGRIWLIWVAAALSMTIGNIAALVQDNIKRLLAYSSIAHAGYLLIAFAVWPNGDARNGITAAMFYTAAYAAMNVGAFAVVGHLAGAGERYVTLEDYSGLGRRSPLLAAILTVFLLSLIGIPITGGFFAKFYVFSSALQQNLVGLVIIGVINSAVAAYYYLRVIVFMYMREPRQEVTVTPIPAGLGLALALSLAATIYLGILPNRVLEYAGRSVDLLR